MCAVLANKRFSLFRSSRSDDGHAMSSRQLDCSNTHTSARSVHKNAFVGKGLSFLKQRSIRCAIGNTHRGALLKRDILRQRVRLRLETHKLLSVAAGHV